MELYHRKNIYVHINAPTMRLISPWRSLMRGCRKTSAYRLRQKDWHGVNDGSRHGDWANTDTRCEDRGKGYNCEKKFFAFCSYGGGDLKGGALPAGNCGMCGNPRISLYVCSMCSVVDARFSDPTENRAKSGVFSDNTGNFPR